MICYLVGISKKRDRVRGFRGPFAVTMANSEEQRSGLVLDKGTERIESVEGEVVGTGPESVNGAEKEAFIRSELGANAEEESSELVVDEGRERIGLAEEGVGGTGVPDLAKEDRAENEAVIRNESAAVEVQRLYRGHRARRGIADAATLAQKFGWWNVVEGAVLQLNSSQFYAYNAPQNAAQRWLRLKMKAAKVGKGLCKNEKARKLALQHWLEAIDPKHRYGHNLHFFYMEWDKSQTHEPFFYWLDLGEGKDLELENCSRKKLQKEMIRYLSPSERQWYEVIVENGKLIKKITREPVNTPKGDKWIFVMSTTGKLYVGKKEKGKLQHSSFLAGGATTAAGRLLVKDGTIELMEAHSGHYHPTPENFHQLISILTSSGADLTVAKVQFVSDDMLSTSGSRKSQGVVEKLDQATGEVVTVGNEAVRDEGDEHENGLARNVGCLKLEDEQLTSCVDQVDLMKVTSSQHTQNNCDVKVKGLELELPEAARFDQYLFQGSIDDDLWERLEGMQLEIIKPTEMSQSSGDSGNANAPLQSNPIASHSAHKLFSPATQTFSKLDAMSLQDVDEAKSGKTPELTPNVKLLLLRKLSDHRMSVNRVLATPS